MNGLYNYNVIDMKSISKVINNLTFTDYFYRLMLLARSVFEWENLPNNIDEKWIERYLFTDGKCMFFKDDTKGFMVCKATDSGELNYYDEPTHLTPYGTNYTGKSLINGKECVLIRNNDEMIPTSPTIQLYAWRLAEISRTIDININAQKTPVLIKCSDKQRLTLKQVYQQWQGNEPVIFGDKQLDTSTIEVLKTEAQPVFSSLQIHKNHIWNEVMTFLGVNNANMDKKERLVDDEVQANNEQVRLSAEMMLKARERACSDINRIFGTNISVKLRVPRMDCMEEIEGSIGKGSDNNE